jgi:hypothetical protein
MIRAKMELPAVQQRVGHSRPTILLEYYAEVLPASADDTAEAMSGLLSSGIPAEFAMNPVEVRGCVFALNGSCKPLLAA